VATIVDRSTARVATVEAPLTLAEPAPRVLGWLDQLGLWGNLGVSLLGPVGAVYVLEPGGVPRLSFAAAWVAVALGTLVGSALLGLAAMPGALTGTPAMMLLRGTFGARLSALPTVVNIVQLVGWATFEIVVITQACQQLLPWHSLRWPYVLVAGALTTVMATRPLGAVRVLRRYALGAVAVVTVWLFIELGRHPMPAAGGSWRGLPAAADFAVAAAVSFAPMASDYSRHSRSARSAFGGAFIGYSVTQIAYYGLGLLALATVVRAGSQDLQHDMFAAIIGVPVGWLAFAVLTARELDESFANAYSTVVSLQNLFPRADRRWLALLVGPLATLLALALTIANYENFLSLLGSVFVPLTAVFLVDFVVRRRRGPAGWDVSESAPQRWIMVLPWLGGFAIYQSIDPGFVGWWARWWVQFDGWLHVSWPVWSSASLFSAAMAALLTWPLSWATARSGAVNEPLPTGSPDGAARS
jgi:putative hydroxymethylpyrimidine transporter CytX